MTERRITQLSMGASLAAMLTLVALKIATLS